MQESNYTTRNYKSSSFLQLVSAWHDYFNKRLVRLVTYLTDNEIMTWEEIAKIVGVTKQRLNKLVLNHRAKYGNS